MHGTNANDIVGTNNGMLQGDATFAPGLVGQAFSFDGDDDFVLVPHDPSLAARLYIFFDPQEVEA